MNPNPGVIDEDDILRPLPIPTPDPKCVGGNCKNETRFEIDCTGNNCSDPFIPPPPPPPPTPCNKTEKCKPGVDCPCTPGVDCPCTKGNKIF